MEQEAAEDQAQRLAQLRAIGDAYVKVFGPPGQPNEFARTVLADLEFFCRYREETLRLDASNRVDPYATIYRDGKRSVIDRIHQRLEWSNLDVDRSGNTDSIPDFDAAKS